MTLIKVKSDAGCFLNEVADERDEKGRLAEAVPIYPEAWARAEQIWRIATAH